MMRHCLLSALVIGLLGCQHQTAQTQAMNVQTMPSLNRSESVFDTPVGPTRRIEFKRAATGDLVRVEFQHLLSGRLVLGQTSVRLDSTGQWQLVNLNENKTTATFKPSSTSLNEACMPAPLSQAKPVLAADFLVDGATWRANITRVYELPKPKTGISTESEPAIDIVACRLGNLRH
jgi:hypothetical protein